MTQQVYLKTALLALFPIPEWPERRNVGSSINITAEGNTFTSVVAVMADGSR
jgi:hypothetical protein